MKSIETAAGDATRYERWLDVRYGSHYNRLHARLYGHIATAINLIQIVAGSAAFVAAIQDWRALALAAGLVVAVVGAISAVVDPSGRAARFDVHARRYGALDAVADTLPVPDLEQRLSLLQIDVQPGEVAALEQPAYNRNVIENGRPDAVVRVSRWERAVEALA